MVERSILIVDEHKILRNFLVRFLSESLSTCWALFQAGRFALTHNLNQPITNKYPTDTASTILEQTAADMSGLARRMRQTK